MAALDSPLHIAEVQYEGGSPRFRYSRYLAADGKKWIRHGPFHAFHPNGQLASEGEYKDGLEDGAWKDYHSNGIMAAQGLFKAGMKDSVWHYWDATGTPEEDEKFVDGVLVRR